MPEQPLPIRLSHGIVRTVVHQRDMRAGEPLEVNHEIRSVVAGEWIPAWIPSRMTDMDVPKFVDLSEAYFPDPVWVTLRNRISWTYLASELR